MNQRRFTEQEVLTIAKRAYEGNAHFEVVPERCALLVLRVLHHPEDLRI